ncbi:MAG: NAD(P)/FAD-dependent oxidoreductase [Pseudomonadota bacterium]
MSSNPTIETDVAIIGAGPVGLFAVFECGMLGMKSCVIDSLDEIGGQCTALYPEKPIYDIPAFPEILAGDLIENLEKQAAPFNPNYQLSQQVVSISKENSLWQLKTSANNVVKAKAIIVAAGAGAFGPNKPPLEGLEEYEGKSVFYMIRKKEEFRDKKVVIAGGGDSAVDWALALQGIAAHVSLVHRRDKFRAAPENVQRLRDLDAEGKLDLVVPFQLKSLEGQGGVLESVCVTGKEGDRKIEADVLLPFYGLAADLGPIKDWELDIESNTLVADPSTCETNIEGIYAVGDIVSYKNKLKLILTGFSEVATAAHAIYKQINPDQALHFEYSTTKGVPGPAKA